MHCATRFTNLSTLRSLTSLAQVVHPVPVRFQELPVDHLERLRDRLIFLEASWSNANLQPSELVCTPPLGDVRCFHQVVAERAGWVRMMLRVLFDAYPHPLSRAELLETAGYKPSGDISTILAKLTRTGWVQVADKKLKAGDTFLSDEAATSVSSA